MTSRLALRGSALLLSVGVGFANACGVANALPQFPQARYEVSGPGVAQYIYFQTPSGQQRAVNTTLPWSTEFKSFGGQVFVISAQGPGPITCKILLDGNEVTTATATTGTPARTVCTH